MEHFWNFLNKKNANLKYKNLLFSLIESSHCESAQKKLDSRDAEVIYYSPYNT